MNWSALLTFCQTTTDRIGQQLLKNFNEASARTPNGSANADTKSDGTLVTHSDQWADQALRDAISAQYPDHGLLSEETTHIFPSNDWCWIIDPIDGTTNFAMGIPVWGISLGLLYRGTPVFGFVAVPPLQETFHGYWYEGSELPSDQRGPTGAYRNGQPIQASSTPLTPNHLFSFCTRSVVTLQRHLEPPFPCKIRMLGVATCNVLSIATGAVLGGLEATPKVWDIAAVWAIAQAAGARWLPLTDTPPFPLQAGQDYQSQSYPTLILAYDDLKPFFYPYATQM
jgi:myo-inositol-1(or 4)-monophosphatase